MTGHTFVDGDDHPGDAISAFVDGELPEADARRLDAHLASCAPCAQAVADEREMRAVVRGLDGVEPPAGFIDRLIDSDGFVRAPSRTRDHARFAAANLVAAAAVWVGIIGFAHVSGLHLVRPPIDDAVSQQAAIDPATVVGSSDANVVSGVPNSVADRYRLLDVKRTGDALQAAYANGTDALLVVAMPGRVDRRSMPRSASAVTVNGRPGWLVSRSNADVIVVERTGMVLVFVGPREPSMTLAEQAAPRPPAPSIGDRIESAGRGLLETFGLAG